jgi:hypothetical protein
MHETIPRSLIDYDFHLQQCGFTRLLRQAVSGKTIYSRNEKVKWILAESGVNQQRTIWMNVTSLEALR